MDSGSIQAADLEFTRIAGGDSLFLGMFGQVVAIFSLNVMLGSAFFG